MKLYNYIKYVLETPKQHLYVNLNLEKNSKHKREPEVFTFSETEIYEYNKKEHLKKLKKLGKLGKLERQKRNKRNKKNKNRVQKVDNSVEIVDGLDLIKQDYNKRMKLLAYKHKHKKDYYKYVLYVEKYYGESSLCLLMPTRKFVEMDTIIFTTHDIKRNLIHMTPKRMK